MQRKLKDGKSGAINQHISLEKRKSDQLEKMPSSRMRYENDEDYYFLMSLLPYLKDVPKRRKLATRIVIQKIVLEEKRVSVMELPTSSDTNSNHGSSSTPNVIPGIPDFTAPLKKIKEEVFTHEMSSFPMDSPTDELINQCQHFLEADIKTEYEPSELYGTMPLVDSQFKSSLSVVSASGPFGNLEVKKGKIITRAESFIHEGHCSGSGSIDILPTHLVDALRASVNHEGSLHSD
ncbi:unnamed protein product [Lymnaea stagnalis]|uniref:BESS domain-containing protein n=1 Tax=Lymnaea stagnalis TaxID=6523 RepID=A0AAV2HV98_LYMST